MKKLDKLLELHKGTTWTQELVDEYLSLKKEFESMENENEKLNQEIKDLRHLVEMNHHEIHELSELEYEVRIEKQKLKEQYLQLKQKLKNAMEIYPCSKLLPILNEENKK